MTITSTTIMFRHAMENRYAVGAFNIDDLNGLKAVLDGLNEKRSPGMIAVTGGSLQFIGLERIEDVRRMMEREARYPIALHLDHGKSVDLCKTCVDLGFTSVMIDASAFEFAENVRQTKEVADYAHARGVQVEAELGAIAGIEDDLSVDDRYGSFTHPEQAREFVERTGVDSLAIAIGTQHGAYKFKAGTAPRLRFDILEEVTELLPSYPIVLHGASSVPAESVRVVNEYGGNMKAAQGIPEDMLREATKKGVVKINVASDLRIAFTGGMRKSLHERPEVFDYKVHLAKGMEAVKAAVEREIDAVLGSEGQGERY